MSAHLAPGRRMNVEDYLAWAETQPEGRYELVDGVPFRMSPERNVHAAVKGAVFTTFREAVKGVGLGYVVLTDGPTVVIDEHRSREPDLVIQSASDLDWESVKVRTPILLVEVTSPSTMRTDTDDKLIEYFSLPSVQHYLLVHPAQRKVVHHRRIEGGSIATSIVASGDLRCDPPGIVVAVDRFFEDLPPGTAF